MTAQCILHYIKDKNYSMWGEKQDGIYQIWRISLWFLYCLTLQKTKFWISVNVQYSITRFSHPSIPLTHWGNKFSNHLRIRKYISNIFLPKYIPNIDQYFCRVGVYWLIHLCILFVYFIQNKYYKKVCFRAV